MKKIIMSLVFILFLIPTVVFAEEKVEIKSITFLEKSENTKINTEASTDGEKINLDLTFYDKNDYATYKIIVYNPTNTGLYINDSYFNKDIEYVYYDFIYNDDNNIVKAGEEKEVLLKVSYKKEIDKSYFRSGQYDASINEPLILSDKLINVPNTLKNLGILGICILLILIPCVITALYILLKNNKYSGVNILIIGLLLILVPKSADALLRIDIPVDSKVLIKLVKPNPCTYDGDLVTGATYVNEQFTYTYKTETNSFGLTLDNDGWAVELTNKNSTDPVTSKLCTTINDKPIVDMSAMFSSSKTKKVDMTSYDTSNVESMQSMFSYAYDIEEIIGLDELDVSKVKRMNYMFGYDFKLKEVVISKWDVSSLTNCDSMFLNTAKDAETAKISVSNFNGSKVINANQMFYNSMINPQNIIFSIDGLNLPIATSVSEPFYGIGTNSKTVNVSIKNVNFESYQGSVYNTFGYIGRYADKVDIVVDNVNYNGISNSSTMFGSVAESAKEVNITINNISFNTATKMDQLIRNTGSYSDKMVLKVSNIHAHKATSSDGFLRGTGNNSKDLKIEVINVDSPSLVNADYMFDHIGQGSYKFDMLISNVNFSNVTSMKYTFACDAESSNSTYVKVKIVDLDTSNVTDMTGTFQYSFGGKNITKVVEGIDTWDFKNVTNMNSMFYNVFASENEPTDLGTIDIYDADISGLFSSSRSVKLVINLHENITNYEHAFSNAAVYPGSQIVVNYTSKVTNIDQIIATKSDSSNIIKGSLIED